MEIVIYTDINNLQKDTLAKTISQSTSLIPVMVFDLEGLFNQIRLKFSGYIVIVFLISSAAELEHLDSHRDHLFNTRYIIILPKSEEILMSKALSLYPRYLAQMNHEFKDVCEVLNKMIQNEKKKI